MNHKRSGAWGSCSVLGWGLHHSQKSCPRQGLGNREMLVQTPPPFSQDSVISVNKYGGQGVQGAAHESRALGMCVWWGTGWAQGCLVGRWGCQCLCPGPPGAMLGGQSLGFLCPKVRREKVAATGNFKCPNWQRGGVPSGWLQPLPCQG